MKRLLLILLLWACWGFALGTLMLAGPVRWTVDWSRSQHWTESQEKIRIYLLITVLAVVTFFIARATAGMLFNQQKKKWRAVGLLLPLMGTCFSFYAFMNPAWMNAGEEKTIGRQFTIGAYPEKEKLSSLKSEGYTMVISLLHPAVVPFEPKLLADEQRLAKEVNLQVVSLPMLPWLSDNLAALDSLRHIVQKATGKVYIHCYLGRDRVNLARRVIEQEAAGDRIENNAFRFRLLDSVKQLERGPVFKLAPEVLLSPFPTKEEYMGYVLAANYRQVVSLADFAEPGAMKLMEEEKNTLLAMKIPFKVYSFSAATSADEMERIVQEIKALPKPLLIHPFFTATKEALLFRQLYQ
jgi:protein tyrosine phosphatase (PTP) superfamily phosphohydrolase (DUF442 family)